MNRYSLFQRLSYGKEYSNPELKFNPCDTFLI